MTKTLEIRVRPVTRWNITRFESDSMERSGSCGSEGEFGSARTADQVALAMKAKEPHARVVTSDGTVHDAVEQQFILTKLNTFEVQNEVHFASTAEEAASLRDKLMSDGDGAKWEIFNRLKSASTDPVAFTAAHDWRFSASYGGELCANCGAVKGARRGNLGCGERAPAAPKVAVSDDMVARFLGWKLPEDFSPDGGIVFNRPAIDAMQPTGTNLLHFGQAKAMLEHCLNGTSG